MIRKVTLLFLLSLGFHSIVNAQSLDSVTISIAPYTDTSCVGTQLMFTAAQSNDTFSTTTYQWYTNGVPTGVIIDTFYTTALNTGDVVYCEIYYINSFGLEDSAMSNNITVYHSASIPPQALVSLIIGSNPDCGGHPLTFSVYPVNGGSAPVYQWMVNDSAVAGADSTTFSGVFAGGDSISCMMVSNSPCAPFDTVYSNVIPVLHYNLTAGVTTSIAFNPICAGAQDTLTATLTNEGSGYNVVWYVDTSTVASALGTQYVTDSLQNGDLVYCVLTAPDSCVLNHIVLSNVITMVVVPNAPSSVSIALTSGTNPGCLDSPVTFTATYANFGTAPASTWYVNGIAVDYNTTVLDTMLSNGDVVSYKMEETDNGCYVNDSLTTPGMIMIRDSTPVAPLISLIGNTIVSNVSSGIFTWVDSVTGIVPGQVNSTLHPPYMGYYWAIRDSANCPSLRSNTLYISLLEVNTISNTDNIQIYPNPTSGVLNMNFDNTATTMQLEIFSVVGTSVIHDEIKNQSHYQTDLSSLPEGTYFVVLKDENGITNTFKIVLGR